MEILFGPKRKTGPVECISMKDPLDGRNLNTVFLMTSPEFKVPVTLPGMVDRVPIRDLGQEWPWIFGQRVESYPIND